MKSLISQTKGPKLCKWNPKSDKLRIYILDGQFIQHKKFCYESGGEWRSRLLAQNLKWGWLESTRCRIQVAMTFCVLSEHENLHTIFFYTQIDRIRVAITFCVLSKHENLHQIFFYTQIDRIHNQSVELSFITWPCSNQGIKSMQLCWQKVPDSQF